MRIDFGSPAFHAVSNWPAAGILAAGVRAAARAAIGSPAGALEIWNGKIAEGSEFAHEFFKALCPLRAA